MYQPRSAVSSTWRLACRSSGTGTAPCLPGTSTPAAAALLVGAIASSGSSPRSPAGRRWRWRRRGRIRQRPHGVGNVEASVGVEPDRLHARRRIVLPREGARDAEDPGAVADAGSAPSASARRRFARSLRPARVAGSAASRRGGCRPCPRRSRSTARARSRPARRWHRRRRSRPTGRRRGGRSRGLRGGGCVARSRRTRRCAGRARSRASPPCAGAPAGRRPPHALAVVEAVAQLEQLAGVSGASERGEQPDGGLVAGRVRGGHGDHVEVVGPAATAPRARDSARRPGGPPAPRRPWRAGRWRPRRWPDLGGLASAEELDALGDDVDPGGVVAVLGLELVEEQPAVDGDLSSGLQVLRAGVGLGVEALDVEIPVVALLAGALDGEPQRADRGAVSFSRNFGSLVRWPVPVQRFMVSPLPRVSGRVV